MSTDDKGSVSPFHFLHRWSMWSAPQIVEYRRLPELGTESALTGGAPILERKRLQKRDCLICNASELRDAGVR